MRPFFVALSGKNHAFHVLQYGLAVNKIGSYNRS